MIARISPLTVSLLLALTPYAVWAGSTVGEATLVIGNNKQITAEGQAQILNRGMSIKVGDRIETSEGGHVHIRFVDGAFVSVRPGSRLVIEDYRHNAQNSEQSAIKFKLEQGTVRSITGQWGEAARDRFRLNTPIAAIGVRGTDFVVQADSERLRAAVHSGAIVVAPLGEGCRADAFGPCATQTAQQLAADMGNVMLELQRRQLSPRLVPLNDLLNPEGISAPETSTRNNATTTTTAANTNTSNRRTDSLAEPLITQSLDNAVVLKPKEPTDKPISGPALVWGRLGEASVGDIVSVPLGEVREGRTPLMGNLRYTLMRDKQQPIFPTGGGKTEFSLQGAFAEYRPSGSDQAQLARVDGGNLSINFDTAQYSTQLNLHHRETGAVGFLSAGHINEQGLFVGTSGNGAISGAIGGAGTEAAYRFERVVEQGRFDGISLWKKPEVLQKSAETFVTLSQPVR